MPTWDFQFGWLWFGWNALAFTICLIVNSFSEWLIHKRIMHARFPLLTYPSELHGNHHTMFGSDETYEALNEDMKNHVRFVPKDYAIILTATLPLWITAELLIGRPVVVGCFFATFSGILLFDINHWLYHVPSGTWYERTKFFRFMRDHHKRHHADTSKNLNVHSLPLADWVLGTLKRGS